MSNMYDADFDGKPYVPRSQQERPGVAPSAQSNMFDADFGSKPYQRPQPPAPAEMRSADYTWTQRLGNKAQDALISMGMAPYNAGRITSALGDISRINPLTGWAPAAADTAYYATSASDMPFGRRAAHTIGSSLGMIPAGKMLFGSTPQKAIAPTGAELETATKAGYRALENSPRRFSPDMVDDVSNEITRALASRNPEDITRQVAAIKTMQDRKTQTGMTPNDFENFRKMLKGGDNPRQIAAGQQAIEVLDAYMRNPPKQHVRVGDAAGLAQDEAVREFARGNAATQFRDEVAAQIARDAEVKASRGKDVGKFIEGKLDTLLTTRAGEKKTAGFNEAEVNRVRDAAAQSLMDKAGAVATSPWAQAAAAPISGATAATSIMSGLDPLTVGVATTLGHGSMYGLGRAAQNAAGRRATQNLETLGEHIRVRSPLAQVAPDRFGVVADPRSLASDAGQYLLYPWASREANRWVDEESVPYRLR